MKKLILISIVALFAAFSCTNINETPEFLDLQAKADSLQDLSNVKGGEIVNFLDDFNEIQENLNKIKEKENIITINKNVDGELSIDNKEQIQQDIDAIYNLMIENQKKLNNLKRKYNSSNKKIAQLQKTITLLEEQLNMKNEEISKLNEQLATLNIEVGNLQEDIANLEMDNEEKDNMIDEKDDEINTAYYVIGTKKELLENQVITKEGGFIGLGKIAKLKDKFNKDYFTKVDTRNTKEISVFSKKGNIITTHPSDSYKLIGDDKLDKIEITNPKEFWGASKYLVIMTD
jgi:DNA repair exonuclease SbcCD ATPase subunit